MKQLTQKLRKAFAIFFVSKRKFIITYYQDGNLNWLHDFHITAKSKKEAVKLFNSYDLESRCDIVDVYVC